MKRSKKLGRTLDAMPDSVDFRDKMYVPTLVEVAPVSDLAAYRRLELPVLDQGREGACTGFGLAAVVNHLMRTGRYKRPADDVSARMLYVMARRYDEWPGENYEGSSARGAMKGWHKHGVCAARLFKDEHKEPDEEGAADSLSRPLGAYFRVNHKDLVSMHSAITEVGTLYATSMVHSGWMDVKTGDKFIKYMPGQVGGHAFAIVGYDRDGFWIQNSWGPGWGDGGLARVSYSDWLENGSDVWVARLGAPIHLEQPEAAARMRAGAPRSYESYVYASLRPHIVTAGNDGKLLETGVYGLTPKGLKDIITTQMPKITGSWAKKRVLLYAHGGLVPMESAVQYVANNREYALKSQVYPIAFIWRSDAWTTIRNILQDAVSRRKSEGVLDASKDFLLDRLDDTLEIVARQLGGKDLWDEMKENADLTASAKNGAARMAADHLVGMIKSGAIDEIHLAAHSAGSILMAALAEYLAKNGVAISSVTLWAPACTMELFKKAYLPLIKSKKIQAFDVYTLDDSTERDDDCAKLYNKSLLYLVSGALEERPRIPLWSPNGTPLLGLARDIEDSPYKKLFTGAHRWVQSPGDKSNARHHGDFDNDEKTLLTTLARVTGSSKSGVAPTTLPTRTPNRAAMQRQTIDLAMQKA